MKKYSSPLAFCLALVLALSMALPALAAESAIEPPYIDATSAILVDADYDEVLYALDPDELRYPASITKVMTGLLTIEAIDRGELFMDTTVTTSTPALEREAPPRG